MATNLSGGLLWTAALLVAWLCGGSPTPAGSGRAPDPQGRDLEDGEALIRYLFHSGWAVKTRNHLLVFDYAESPSTSSRRSLEGGSIDPREMAQENLTVFTSHAHADHFDPRILEWKAALSRIRYVWGWERPGSPGDIHFGRERRKVAADGLEILNVHHTLDGIPESAFLVRVDGLTIVHSGDHGRSRDRPDPVFADNLGYLSRQAPRLDILFTHTFGGAVEALRTLSPRAVLPMHSGGRESDYGRFADEVRGLGLDVEVGVAAGPGDRFLYSPGRSPALRKEG